MMTLLALCYYDYQNTMWVHLIKDVEDYLDTKCNDIVAKSAKNQ